jgi:hypothetical protein
MRRHLIAATAMFGSSLLLVALPPSANSLTLKECSAKYQAAKKDGTLSGRTWQAYRKAECGADASPAAQEKTQEKKQEKKASQPTAAPAAVGNAVFPSAISQKYASESAGRARMHTCLDQYNANKATNSNGDLRWIQRGGGYYSECNKRLKG